MTKEQRQDETRFKALIERGVNCYISVRENGNMFLYQVLLKDDGLTHREEIGGTSDMREPCVLV